MSDAMYESIAHAALRRCTDHRSTRRILAGFQQERDHAKSTEARKGFDLVIAQIKARLAAWPELPLEAERGP